jgi:hypothetical protein
VPPKKASKSKPKPTAEIQKKRKRVVVASGILKGKKIKAISQEMGVTPRRVQQIAAEPETQFLIAQALEPYTGELKSMLPQVMAALSEALSAEKTDTADHFTRLRAIERHGELMERAQGKPREEAQTGLRLMTAEQFFFLTRERA